MKKNFITTVEITDTHIKVLQARAQSGKRSVSFCDIKKLKENAGEHIIESLAHMPVKKQARGNCIAVIPRRLVMLKQMALPSDRKEEIRRMIALALAHQVPYPAEEIIFGFLFLGKEPCGNTQVLAVIVHKETIEKYLGIFKKAGFNPHQIVVSSFGILNWFVSLQGKQDQPLALIHMDDAFSEICFCHGEKLLFSRNINFGARDLKEENICAFMGQINLSLEAYSKEKMGEGIQGIVILSEKEESVFLKEKLGGRYPFPVDVLIKEDVPLAASLGFLLTDSCSPVNLMPAHVLDARAARIQRRKAAKFIVTVMAVLGVIISVFIVGINEDAAYLKELKTKQARTEAEAQRAEKEIRFLDFVKGQTRRRVFVMDVIRELHNLTPGEITFRSFDFNRNESLDIQGSADTGTRVNDFQKRLVRSPFFTDVTLQYATKRRKFQQEYTDFKITFKLAEGNNSRE